MNTNRFYLYVAIAVLIGVILGAVVGIVEPFPWSRLPGML